MTDSKTMKVSIVCIFGWANQNGAKSEPSTYCEYAAGHHMIRILIVSL